ncbi:hypothetical protein L2E82_30260 [Cichorium intybus]|uniref:Uncharacterized protein n=1 Tax=Cichorium intybus TaxID=13427 RepID=A0ACB9D0B4_CICIN|nr:hypothetical protein L2E82_30260 [Cichorium intybus]
MASVIATIENALDIQGFPGSEFLGSTNIIAGGFLNLHPSELLKFPFQPEKLSRCSLQLTNKTDQFIAFKVQTTNPMESYVTPKNGIILPRSVCNAIVTIKPQNEAPSDMQCKCKFKVLSTIAPNGATKKDITISMFDKEDDNVVEELKLRAVYIPVLEESLEDSSLKENMESELFIA